MYKKNKEQLKKIYEEEFLKAEKKESQAALDREIARIKAKAREDAKHKSRSWKDRGKTGIKKAAKKGRGAGKKIQTFKKKHGKRLRSISENVDRMNREIMGY